MARLGVCACVLVVVISLTNAQIPPRLNIPGAVLLPQQHQKQNQVIRQRLQQLDGPRIRSRPPPLPVREAVRPVIEELEDDEPRRNTFDEEVARFSIPPLQSISQDDEPAEKPLPFRPEPRPLPVLRQDIRENQKPLPVRQERPVIRQELKQDNFRPLPIRQELREDQPILVRRPQPPPQPQQPNRQQPVRQAPRIAPRPAPQYIDQDEQPTRAKKKPIQILRKYRTDNEDGSITWGYENEDGSFKEENIGIDCITRGKYGYIDPEGTRREYSYETGGKCEDPDPEEIEDLPPRPLPKGGQAKKPQYRPQPPPQYVN